MSKTVGFRFASREPNYLSDKYIKEIQNEIPFDMELVSTISSKKVEVHRFVVMMFSKQIRNLLKDSGNSFKNGHVIVPVNVPYSILLKVIELFYDCQTIIPVNLVPDMRKALNFFQVDNVMDQCAGSMPPPINVPHSSARMSVNNPAPFNRRQTMVQMQPIDDSKRRRSNMVPLPVRPHATLFEQPRPIKQARPQAVSKFVPGPVPAARNMSLMAITHGNNSLASSPASENGKNKFFDESNNKFPAEKVESSKEGDTNKENERPELNLDVDISNDQSFKDLMSGLEADIDLNY